MIKQAAFTICMATLLSACGGGGSDSNTSTSSPATPTSASPATGGASPSTASTAVVNPLTGTVAPGSQTKTIAGTALPGSTVTAYNVQPDGSNGAALGAPAVTDSGTFRFNLSLNTAPTGMVRLVATGGANNYRSEDATRQPQGPLELVVPYVTTAYNDFKMTSMGNIVSKAFTAQAKKGATLANAFRDGSRRVIDLDIAQTDMREDVNVYLNIPKGSIKSATTAYAGALDDAKILNSAIDQFGVLYDLPIQDNLRVISSSAESGYAATGVDGAGNPIIVGAWANGTFNSQAPVTLKALMDSRTPTSLKAKDGQGNQTITPRVNELISNAIMAAYMDNSCRFGTSTFTDRYPLYTVGANGRPSSADCAAAAQRLADIQARVATNNSTKLK